MLPPPLVAAVHAARLFTGKMPVLLNVDIKKPCACGIIDQAAMTIKNRLACIDVILQVQGLSGKDFAPVG